MCIILDIVLSTLHVSAYLIFVTAPRIRSYSFLHFYACENGTTNSAASCWRPHRCPGGMGARRSDSGAHASNHTTTPPCWTCTLFIPCLGKGFKVTSSLVWFAHGCSLGYYSFPLALSFGIPSHHGHFSRKVSVTLWQVWCVICSKSWPLQSWGKWILLFQGGLIH